MEEKAKIALENVTSEVLELFKTQYVDKYVYNSHGANQVYHGGSAKPTGQFREAWEWEDIKKVTNTLVTAMWYNPKNLSFDSDTFLHGSKYSSPTDVRNTLMDILNTSGYSSSLWLSVSRSNAYWDEFITDMFSSSKLSNIIKKHFVKQGFTIK